MLPTWRKTLFLAIGGNIIVLAFNLGFVLWAVQRHGLQNKSGLLYEGKCNRVREMSIGLHFVVNIFSMGLLAASNYCMQCLSAPTRSDIDRAHQKGSWVDIGVPSVRNLIRVPRQKSALWIVLLVCSLPLHFFYNATVFSVVSANDYDVFAGAGSLGQKDLSELTLQDPTNGASWPSFVQLYHGAQADNLSTLTPAECFHAYTTPFQTSHGNLLVVTETTSDTDYAVLDRDIVFHPGENYSEVHPWMCRRDTDTSCVATLQQAVQSHNWTINGVPVTGCLSESSPANCKLQYTLPLTMVVVAFNLVHAVIMILTAIRMESPILTIGDAVASFMNRPDHVTRGHPLLSRDTLHDLYELHSRLQFNPTPRRWYTAVSITRWTGGILSYLITITISLALIAYALTNMQDRTHIWQTAFNMPNHETLITAVHWPVSLLANNLIANTPQLLFSTLYLTTNSILSTMTLSSEWSHFARLRRGLRVSTPPAISQRTSSYLSLPPRFCLPLVVFCGVLHFLGSQSLFLMNVQVYTATHGRDPARDIVTVAYAPAAIVACLALGAAGFIALLVVSQRRFASGMPVAGSCSLAIAAACHPFEGETEMGMERLAPGNPQAGYFPLKWDANGTWGFSW